MTTTHARASRSAARSPRPWALASAVLAGQAMASLDTAIVNVAGPSLQRGLNLSGATLQLAVYAYVLVYAVALVLGARLGARHGYGRIFVLGTALFTVSSLACGLAMDPAMLIAARAVQGLGAALLVPQVLSILQTTFDGQRRRRALSLYGLVLAVGVAAGQVLGGLLVGADLLGTGWRPIFLVNVPIGIAVLTYSLGRLRVAPDPARRRPLDVTGALLLAAAIVALVTPVTFGADARWPWWTFPVLLTGVILLPIFARHETRLAATARQPLLDPRALATIRRPVIGIFTLMGCYGGLLFTIALYLQHALNQSPLRSGLTFAGYALGFATASLTWTRLPARCHPRVPAAATITVVAAEASLAWITWTAAGHGWPWQATGLLAVAGAGHGAGFGALVQRATMDLTTKYAPALSGLISTTNQLAIVTGIAATGSLYLSIDRDIGTTMSRPPAMSWVLLVLAATQAIVAVAALRPGTSHRRGLDISGHPERSARRA